MNFNIKQKDQSKSFEEFLFDDILDESFTKGFEELLEK